MAMMTAPTAAPSLGWRLFYAVPVIGWIARDIARIHGGDIALSRSSLGGLKAVLKVPV